MSRKLCFLAFVAVFLIAICGCANTSSLLPENCKKVEPLKEYRVVQASYASVPEDELIGSRDLIFKGVVLEKTEYMVESSKSKEDPSRYPPRYVGMIKYKISDVIYTINDSIRVGDEISILTYFTSHRWTPESIDQKVDTEYIIFAEETDSSIENDPFNYFKSVSQYGITCPFRNVVTITDEGVEFHSAFTTLAQRAHLTNRVTPYNNVEKYYVMNEQDFIAELKKLIELYKQPQATILPEETMITATPTNTPMETIMPTETTADTTYSSETSKPDETATETIKPTASLEPAVIT